VIRTIPLQQDNGVREGPTVRRSVGTNIWSNQEFFTPMSETGKEKERRRASGVKQTAKKPFRPKRGGERFWGKGCVLNRRLGGDCCSTAGIHHGKEAPSDELSVRSVTRGRGWRGKEISLISGEAGWVGPVLGYLKHRKQMRRKRRNIEITEGSTTAEQTRVEAAMRSPPAFEL